VAQSITGFHSNSKKSAAVQSQTLLRSLLCGGVTVMVGEDEEVGFS
jgi:hypothetical protein